MSGMQSVVVISGTRERLQMAAMVASVAAVSGDRVTVFVSMNALPFFRRGNTESAPAEGLLGGLLAEKGAPSFMQLFRSSVELGDAKIHPCSMAVDLLGVGPDDLEPWLCEPMGLTKFLSDAHGGQAWSF